MSPTASQHTLALVQCRAWATVGASRHGGCAPSAHPHSTACDIAKEASVSRPTSEGGKSVVEKVAPEEKNDVGQERRRDRQAAEEGAGEVGDQSSNNASKNLARQARTRSSNTLTHCLRTSLCHARASSAHSSPLNSLKSSAGTLIRKNSAGSGGRLDASADASRCA